MGEGTQGTGTGPDGSDGPAEPDDGGGGEGDEPPSALEELEQGRVDPRLLQPDPGESRGEFEARLLTTLLGLDEPSGGGGGGEVAGPATGPDLTPPDADLGPEGSPREASE